MNELKNESDTLKRITELVNQTYQAKKDASAAEAKFKELKNALCELMEAAEVDKLIGEECTASGKIESKVSLGKDISTKQKVFDYIKNKYSEEVLMDMLTINPRTFISWYNAELEAEMANGNIDFQLEGIKPFDVYTVGFRKRNK